MNIEFLNFRQLRLQKKTNFSYTGRTTSIKRNIFQSKIIKETETIVLLTHTLKEMALLKLLDKGQVLSQSML